MKICKYYQKIRRFLYRKLSTCKRFSGKWHIYQPTIFNGEGEIIGCDATIGYNPSPYFYAGSSYIEARCENAKITIGRSVINNNFCCVAESKQIIIGNDCLIGCNVTIMNSDFHSIKVSERNSGNHKSKDVIIGNNVWIGNDVTILKGVHVGDGAVIANGAVVFDSVPAKTIVRGNPAVIYKEIID